MTLSNFFLQLPPPSQLPPTQFAPNPIGVLPQINIQDLGSYGFFGLLNSAIIPILAILFIMIIGIIFIRYHQNLTSYYSTENRLANRYRIVIGNAHFDCRLNQVDPIMLEESLEIIKRIPEIARNTENVKAIETIKQRIIDKQLFLYHAKVIDKKYIRLRGNVGYGMVLSSENLNDPAFYNELSRGIASAASPTFREYPRMVTCLKSGSRQYNLQTETRRIAPVFVIAPTKDPEYKPEMELSKGLEAFDIPPVLLKINLIIQPKELAQIMLILQTTADLYEKIEAKTIQNDSLIKMYRDQQDKTIAKQGEADYFRGELIQQELEKIGADEIRKEEKTGLMWMLGAIIVAFISTIIPPEVPQLATMPNGLALGISELILLVFYFILESNKKKPEERMKDRSRGVHRNE